MNNNNIEFKLLDRKSDLEDVVQECSAYLKTKQFMADRIYQQQEEIQILKQQIFSLSSTNSQLGRFIENFEKETFNLKEKLGKKELKAAAASNHKENLNPNILGVGINMKLVSKGISANCNLNAGRKNAAEAENNNNFNNKFNLSDDDPLMKSEVLPGGFEENKDGSFSDFEQMNYNLIESTSQNSEECNNHNNINENENFYCGNNKNENFENGSLTDNNNKIVAHDLAFICDNNNNKLNDLKRSKNKFEDIKITERNETQENFYPKKNSNNSALHKQFTCNSNFTCNHTTTATTNNNNNNNNINLSFYNYNFQINNEKNLADERIQKLNNEVIEKTIENNKLRTDKFIIMSELNEILTSLTRIDLDKLNDFYLSNISRNNLSKYLMPTAKGIKFNILSCQNNLAKIIKSDLIKNYELENLYPKNFIENFHNNDQHYNKNYSGNNNNNHGYSVSFNPNYHISPIQNPRKLSNNEPNAFEKYNCSNNVNLKNMQQTNDNADNLINTNKKKIKNVLEKNFNMNVNGLCELFSKHEGEFEALLEKKLMKLNRNNIRNTVGNNSNNCCNNNYNKFNNNVDNQDCNVNRNHYGINRISKPSHYSTSTHESYSP